MTAKLTPFSHNVGKIYRGFLTGNFYLYTLTISFCLRVWMVSMEKNWNLNIFYNSHSLLFNSWIIKNVPEQMTLSFSFDIIIWYPFFQSFRYELRKRTENTELIIPIQTGLVLLPATWGWRERDGGGRGGGGEGDEEGDRKSCQKTRCKLFPLSLRKGASSAVIVETILKLFYFKVRCGVSPFITLSLNLTHSIPR